MEDFHHWNQLLDNIHQTCDEITDHLNHDRLMHHVGCSYAFLDVPQAHEDLEAGSIYGIAQITINDKLEFNGASV